MNEYDVVETKTTIVREYEDEKLVRETETIVETKKKNNYNPYPNTTPYPWVTYTSGGELGKFGPKPQV